MQGVAHTLHHTPHQCLLVNHNGNEVNIEHWTLIIELWTLNFESWILKLRGVEHGCVNSEGSHFPHLHRQDRRSGHPIEVQTAGFILTMLLYLQEMHLTAHLIQLQMMSYRLIVQVVLYRNPALYIQLISTRCFFGRMSSIRTVQSYCKHHKHPCCQSPICDAMKRKMCPQSRPPQRLTREPFAIAAFLVRNQPFAPPSGTCNPQQATHNKHHHTVQPAEVENQ